MSPGGRHQRPLCSSIFRGTLNLLRRSIPACSEGPWFTWAQPKPWGYTGRSAHPRLLREMLWILVECSLRVGGEFFADGVFSARSPRGLRPWGAAEHYTRHNSSITSPSSSSFHPDVLMKRVVTHMMNMYIFSKTKCVI